MSLIEGLLGLGSAVGGAGMVGNAYDRLGEIGQQAQAGSNQIANEAMANTAFNPYGVTTTTGSQFNVGPNGSVTTQLGAQEQAIQDQALGGATGLMQAALQPNAQTEQNIYDRMRALQIEDENRQALELENRLFAQGRLGTSSDMYGGATPEMLAMQQANARARNEAALSAMGQARQDQMQNAQLANSFLGMGYLPQAQLQGMSQAGYNNAALAQAGQLTGADLYGQARMGGLEALLGAGQGQANMIGQVGASMLGGSLSNATGEDGWLSALGSLFD